LVLVCLRDVDVELFWRMDQHHSAVLREFTLIAIGAAQDELSGPPGDLLRALGDLRARYAAPRGRLHELMRAAAEAGLETATVEVDVPTAAADGIEATLQAFEQTDEYCRGGQLLTLATAPDVAAFRRALSNAILAQLRA
jgi:hypothetical protein